MSKGVQKIFSQVPRTYELLNHVLTLGLDILWRRRAARLAVSRGGNRWLEVCSGTGEISLYLSHLGGRGTEIVSVDFSLPMLEIARAKPESNRLNLTLSDVTRLPFPDESFETVVISFATRNINLSRAKLTETFNEFHRVLRPGGVFINLETSQPPSRIIRWLFHKYLRLLVRPIGRLVSGSRTGYSYLSYTARHFYDADGLTAILHNVGFAKVIFNHVTLGVAAIHMAVK